MFEKSEKELNNDDMMLANRNKELIHLFWLPLLKYDQDSDFIIDFIRATFE
jgi:hypothetical protein